MTIAVRGGDIRQLTINGREFSVMKEATVNIDLGGFQNDGGLNGNGTLHINQQRKLAGFSDCPISIDDSEGDYEFLQNLANTGEPVPITITLASTTTYSGTLSVWGELQKNTGEGSATLEMRGESMTRV
jgi:hypothetical protein